MRWPMQESADCYSILRAYGWDTAGVRPAPCIEAVANALALDPRLPEAHFSKALCVFHFERHWRSARQHLVDALELSRRVSIVEACRALSGHRVTRYAEADTAYPSSARARP